MANNVLPYAKWPPLIDRTLTNCRIAGDNPCVYRGVRIPIYFLVCSFALTSAAAQDQPAYAFGTTVVDLAGLEGRVYLLRPGTAKLPNFSHMHPAGTVYTTTLNVWPQPFSEGFPSISDRFEWFGIAYSGKFWVETAGEYRFSLLADDGARLRVDRKLVIDNDGLHGAAAISAAATLSRGAHAIEVDYFQGPRFTVALVLAIAPPERPWRIFNTNDFKPPADPAQWQTGAISEIKPQTVGISVR
ncbi:MAG: PA14 domain-containing protein [Ignavibacteriota bacterium]